MITHGSVVQFTIVPGDHTDAPSSTHNQLVKEKTFRRPLVDDACDLPHGVDLLATERSFSGAGAPFEELPVERAPVGQRNSSATIQQVFTPLPFQDLSFFIGPPALSTGDIVDKVPFVLTTICMIGDSESEQPALLESATIAGRSVPGNHFAFPM